MKNRNIILGMAAILMLPLLAHADTSGVEGALDKAADKVEKAADKAADKVDKAADKVGDKIEKAADSAKETLSDTAITANVKSKILSEKFLSVSVETKEGVVHLSGTVESEEQLKKAVDLAKSADGVKDVKSEIVVKSKTEKKS